MFSHQQNIFYTIFFISQTFLYDSLSHILNMSIRPYSFEPTVDDIDMVDIHQDRNESEMRVQLEGRTLMNVNDDCLCNKCIRFTTDQECVCCFELEKLHNLLPSSNKNTCITEISSFSKIILDEGVSRRLDNFITQCRPGHQSAQAASPRHPTYHSHTIILVINIRI